MRWVFALAFCIAAGATAWGGATEEHAGLRVTIGYAMATADPEDDENRLGVRYWDVSPPVTLESARRCDRADVAVSQRLDFNGTLLAAREQDGLSPIDLKGDGYRFTGSIHGPGDASAGERVHFTAKARCFTGETVSTASTTRTFELPLASCDSGPLRVGEVKGLVSGEDWNHGAVTLQPGDVITPGSDLRVPPGGQVELGNPECNAASESCSPPARMASARTIAAAAATLFRPSAPWGPATHTPAVSRSPGGRRSGRSTAAAGGARLPRHRRMRFARLRTA